SRFAELWAPSEAATTRSAAATRMRARPIMRIEPTDALRRRKNRRQSPPPISLGSSWPWGNSCLVARRARASEPEAQTALARPNEVEIASTSLQPNDVPLTKSAERRIPPAAPHAAKRGIDI